MSQIDGVVQQNAAMVNDAAQTTRELSVEARQLAELVGSFRLEEADGGAPAPEHRARAIQTRLLNEA
ncbi:hypothetical protein PY257_04155 [Ramlibacter sp. H39-3-26]|uniref:hypothetical protein n=1 Tax=Curvibacter soli TaxID=3031331 RepID=UPI0023DAC767|nr:hypothetical protein [Ramlibacter sp. H39-3-26]MDF1484379.1 hypothetical protein [Ramlibacter sp. H39-3-26]